MLQHPKPKFAVKRSVCTENRRFVLILTAVRTFIDLKTTPRRNFVLLVHLGREHVARRRERCRHASSRSETLRGDSESPRSRRGELTGTTQGDGVLSLSVCLFVLVLPLIDVLGWNSHGELSSVKTWPDNKTTPMHHKDSHL